MRTPKNEHPAVIVNERPGFGRVAFYPPISTAVRPRQPARHGRLLATWRAGRRGRSCRLPWKGRAYRLSFYRQPGRVILHLVNLTSAGTWRAPVDELIPVGPLRVRLRLPGDVAGRQLRLLVSGRRVAIGTQGGWAHFEVPSVRDHEVVLIEA